MLPKQELYSRALAELGRTEKLLTAFPASSPHSSHVRRHGPSRGAAFDDRRVLTQFDVFGQRSCLRRCATRTYLKRLSSRHSFVNTRVLKFRALFASFRRYPQSLFSCLHGITRSHALDGPCVSCQHACGLRATAAAGERRTSSDSPLRAGSSASCLLFTIIIAAQRERSRLARLSQRLQRLAT